ncbi:hypothetical protein [Kitasatospora sp. NPDC004289]
MSGALELERELLAGMAALAAGQGAEDATVWAALERELRQETGEGPEAEWRLELASRQVRTLLLRRGHRMDERFQRSPDLAQERTLPGGAPLRHGYERSLPAEAVERALAGRSSGPPEGWERTVLAFGSGMAALSHLVQSLAHLLAPTERRPLRLDFWGDYFETDLLLEYLSGTTLRPRRLAPGRLAGAFEGPEAPDVLLLEPVRYNWALDVLDVNALVNGWRRGPHRPPVVVLDTTLVSPAWPRAAVLKALASPAGAPLVIEVRSGLKLDQQGLEVANLGVLEIHQHRSHTGELTARRLAGTLRLVRATTGQGLAAPAVAALDAPFLLDETWTRRHAGQVYRNNARLAERLASSPRPLFRTVAHPALGSSAWRGQSPFVVVELREDALADHGLLLAVIRHEVARRGLAAVYGNSFGFRTTRFETVVPRTATGQGLFKLAAGSRGGPSLDLFCDLLLDIGDHQSMKDLRATYDLAPVGLT